MFTSEEKVDRLISILEKESNTLQEIINPKNNKWDNDDWAKFWTVISFRATGIIVGLILMFAPAFIDKLESHTQFFIGAGSGYIGAMLGGFNGSDNNKKKPFSG